MLLVYYPAICHDRVTPSVRLLSPPRSWEGSHLGQAGCARVGPNWATRVLTTLARDWGAVTIRKVEITMAALDPFRSDCLSGGVASP